MTSGKFHAVPDSFVCPYWLLRSRNCRDEPVVDVPSQVLLPARTEPVDEAENEHSEDVSEDVSGEEAVDLSEN